MKRPGKTSRGEFRAVLALACILIASIFLPKACSLMQQEKAIDLPAFTTLETASQRDSATQQKAYQSRQFFSDAKRARRFSSENRNTFQKHTDRERTRQIVCYAFDPNRVEADTLIAMGVRPYTAKNIIRYREAGGVFRTPEDLQRIYGMDSITFQSLIPCLQIMPVYAHTSRRSSAPIDINTAGVEEWQSLPGIGKVFAERIVKFRTHLGGFHSVSQVGETYGLPTETMESISGMLLVNSVPGQIDLNTATVEELDAHPYISRRQAETIVNFRSNHGTFAQVEDAMKIYSLSPEWLERMGPYLTVGKDRDLVSR